MNAQIAERFFLMPTVLFAPFVAWGLKAVAERLRPALVLTVVFAVAALNGLLSYQTVNWRSDTIIERYLVASVSSLPKNAVVLGRSDTLLPGMAWRERVLRVRPDVHYVDVNMLTHRWYFDRVQRELAGLDLAFTSGLTNAAAVGNSFAKAAPTFLFPWIVPDARISLPLEPAGLLYRVVPPGTKTPLAEVEAGIRQALATLGDATELPLDAWSAKVHQAIGYTLMDLQNAYKAAGDEKKAAELTELLLQVVPPPSPDDIDDVGETPSSAASL